MEAEEAEGMEIVEGEEDMVMVEGGVTMVGVMGEQEAMVAEDMEVEEEGVMVEAGEALEAGANVGILVVEVVAGVILVAEEDEVEILEDEVEVCSLHLDINIPLMEFSKHDIIVESHLSILKVQLSSWSLVKRVSSRAWSWHLQDLHLFQWVMLLTSQSDP